MAEITKFIIAPTSEKYLIFLNLFLDIEFFSPHFYYKQIYYKIIIKNIKNIVFYKNSNFSKIKRLFFIKKAVNILFLN